MHVFCFWRLGRISKVGGLWGGGGGEEVHCTSVQSAVFSVQCVVCSVQSAVCSV